MREARKSLVFEREREAGVIFATFGDDPMKIRHTISPFIRGHHFLHGRDGGDEPPSTFLRIQDSVFHVSLTP